MSSKLPVSISFSTIANYLGTAGIIGSLIFVGLELRQSHQIALAGQVQARNAMLSNFIMSPLQGNEKALVLWDSVEVPLTTEEQHIRNQIIRHRVLTGTNAWQQYELGLLSEDAWSQAERRTRGLWIDCSTRSLARITFTPSLVGYAQENWSNENCD